MRLATPPRLIMVETMYPYIVHLQIDSFFNDIMTSVIRFNTKRMCLSYFADSEARPDLFWAFG